MHMWVGILRYVIFPLNNNQCLHNTVFLLILVFNSDAVQSALLQVQASCSDAQKTKFSDLFALVEELDDLKTTKSGRMGGRGKVSGPKNMKSKATIVDSDTETDSTEDEEATKPKPRKKKRTLMGFDSD
ncbi:hypothetical protein JTE90_010583 [Oedothorax gibbosus]|uniref:Ints3-like C-terminal domain-containing protein n=1 Tax=Oedothorax gibbosus TaxID=931172 RepID=A0AAV6V4L9_9ARAC|nr:hypothetical protein JTE90_010583 [Oedothorax gibbosus]